MSSDAPALRSSPTKMRFAVVGVATLTSVLLYLDRLCLGIAQGYIQEDLGLTNQDIGWLFSAFFWSYALGQVPAGLLSDRYGARLMMTLYVFTWSLLTAATGFAAGLASLIGFRLAFGFAQAGAYPTSGGLLSRWVPVQTRGTASSIVALGGRIGGVLAPMLTAVLITWFARPYPAELTARDFLPGKASAWSQTLLLIDPASNDSGYAAAEVRRRIDADAELAAIVRASRDRAIASSPQSDFTDAEAALVVQRLNQLLADPSLTSVILQHDPKRIPAESHSLSADERFRLHRKWLEDTFPQTIRKHAGQGWRATVIFYGLIGIVVAACVWVVFRETPAQHPWCNAEEQALIGVPPLSAKPPPIPWAAIFTTPSQWSNCLTQIGTNIGWLFIVTLLPKYLEEIHHVDIVTRGFMSGMPMAAGVVGMLLGGPITDVCARIFGLRWGRAAPVIVTRALAAWVFFVVPFVSDPWVVVGLLSLVAFFCDAGIAAIWAFCQDVGGRYVGAVLGWGNMWGNLAAAVAPPLYVYFLTNTPSVQTWNHVFYVCAISFVASGVFAFGLDGSSPLQAPEGGAHSDDAVGDEADL